SVNYRPLLDLSLFKEKMKIDSAKFPNAKNIGDTTVTLPLYPSLLDEEVEYVIEAVKKVAGKLF
ncbi:MAG: DegT/DnrJ/EryC1/StrS family aminotransferase, partial [Deltaproteobacteria bacterium]|nr:DegT/DnrJ/EryC1/StrS family aminotransferase [Deltaproteobacteria bacterium]